MPARAGTLIAVAENMKPQISERGPRQVTVQPQEKPPQVGQPNVPHRKIEQPGEPPPDSESERSKPDEPPSH
jgi:hypothetical protein